MTHTPVTPDCAAPSVVKQLDSALAELEKYQWISVEDRLPECYGTVLTYHPDDGNGEFYSVICVGSDGKWLGVDGYTQPTHWMLLPEPPK